MRVAGEKTTTGDNLRRNVKNVREERTWKRKQTLKGHSAIQQDRMQQNSMVPKRGVEPPTY